MRTTFLLFLGKLFDNRYSSTVQDRWYLIQLLKFIANEKNGAYAIAMAPGMSKRIIEQLEDENKFLYRAALELVNSMVAKSFLAGKVCFIFTLCYFNLTFIFL